MGSPYQASSGWCVNITLALPALSLFRPVQEAGWAPPLQRLAPADFQGGLPCTIVQLCTNIQIVPPRSSTNWDTVVPEVFWVLTLAWCISTNCARMHERTTHNEQRYSMKKKLNRHLTTKWAEWGMQVGSVKCATILSEKKNIGCFLSYCVKYVMQNVQEWYLGTGTLWSM